HEAEDEVPVVGTDPVEDPVRLPTELAQRLGLDVVLLVPAAQLGVGEGGGDQRHRLVLLAAQVRQQGGLQRVDRGQQPRPLRPPPAWAPRPESAGGAATASMPPAIASWSACMLSSRGAASGSRSRTIG